MHKSSHKSCWNLRRALAVAAALFAGGCGRDAAVSYTIPKEDYTPKLSATPGPGKVGRTMPKVHWEKPKGWEEKAGEQMRVGSFQIPGDEGKFAEVRIIPLTAASDIESQSVAMWREELGLPHEETKPEEVAVGDLKARLYDFTSPDARFQGKYKARTVAAILEQAGTLWFVKMSGEASVVGRERETFREFVKSLKFDEDTQVASGDSGNSGWKKPANWKEQPAGQMVLASYTADGADISVSAFEGSTGGLLANVNRWRGQVGLGPIGGDQLPREVKEIELADGSKASVVDVAGTSARTGKAARLYGLVVPRGDKTWFYKMLGDSDAVAREITHLAEFAATAH
jgi:hypothetical protein